MLPSNWSINLERDPVIPTDRGVMRPDALMTIRAPDGAEATVIVEAKRRLDPRDVSAVASQLWRYQQNLTALPGMLVVPFLPPRSRELLTDASLSYADSTGNIRFTLDRPAVYIRADGASSDPWAAGSDRALRSLKGPTTSRIVRALIDFCPPFGVQQLAERSGTSLGSVSRVFAFLEPEALIVRAPYGPVTAVKWDDLIRRWTMDYGFSKSNRVQTFLDPRGLPALLNRLRSAPSRYAVTGSLAANDLAPIASPRLAAIYVDDAVEAADRLRLRPAEAGANVILAEPFDPVVYDRTRDVDGIRYAAPSQVAADLLTGPGRNPAEGEEVIRWMRENEDVWRR